VEYTISATRTAFSPSGSSARGCQVVGFLLLIKTQSERKTKGGKRTGDHGVYKIAHESKICAPNRPGGIKHKHHVERPKTTLIFAVSGAAASVTLGCEEKAKAK
jgi:hypothetical protein